MTSVTVTISKVSWILWHLQFFSLLNRNTTMQHLFFFFWTGGDSDDWLERFLYFGYSQSYFSNYLCYNEVLYLEIWLIKDLFFGDSNPQVPKHYSKKGMFLEHGLISCSRHNDGLLLLWSKVTREGTYSLKVLWKKNALKTSPIDQTW